MWHQQRQQPGSIVRCRCPAHIAARRVVHERQQRRRVSRQQRRCGVADVGVCFKAVAAGKPHNAVVQRSAGARIVRRATDGPQHVARVHAGQLILIAHQQ